MVNSDYSNNTAKFLAKFSAIEIPAKSNLVIALDGAGFQAKFSFTADFEIRGTDGNTADMTVLYAGSNIKLESSNGILILFQWDGVSDLVQDIDYIAWGFFTTGFMDKSGVSIDGPDANNNVSAYFDDLSVLSQKKATIPSAGQSLQRNGIIEIDEAASGGNGVGGHNEATENWQNSFVVSSPSPGSFSEIEGDGSGSATVLFNTLNANEINDPTFTIKGAPAYTLTSIQLTIPSDWTLTDTVSVDISGPGFTGADISLNDRIINITNAHLTNIDTGTVFIYNLITPSQTTTSNFNILTAVAGGNLTSIASQPLISIIAKLSIADIQNNFNDFNGQQVTLDAIVAIGAGITRNDHTDAYIQDGSGRGINLFRSNDIVTDLAVGNEVRVTGTVSEFSGTTQISDFTIEVLSTGNEVPAVALFTVAQASNTELEGTFVETAGIIEDLAFNIGGGTNLTINDGTGSITARIWDNTGVDLSIYSVGDTVAIRAVIDMFNSAAQLLLAYDDDIFFTSIETAVDGSGTVSVDPASVNANEPTSLTFTFTATAEDAIDRVTVLIPNEWQWSGAVGDVSVSGAFSSASVAVSGKLITISNALLSSLSDGEIGIDNLTSPVVDTVSTFVVQTAGILGSLSDIAIQPIVTTGDGTQITTITIGQARALPIGSEITIKGTIVIGAGILRDDFTSAYVVDEDGAGLNVFRFGEIDPDIVRGNLVIMKGELAEFDGTFEIENYTTKILAQNAPLPTPNNLTTGQAALEEFEGLFVSVQGAVTEKFSAGGGTNLVVDDGSGAVTIRIWNTTGVDVSAFAEGDFVSVQGIHSLFNNAGQILLAYQEDISQPEFDIVPTVLIVPNKPFAPDKGEKLPIIYSPGSENAHVTIRIFDLGGRLITTIFDGNGVPLIQTENWDDPDRAILKWDGRDERGEQVPIGTYILHFEVTNEDTGKKTQKAAPIVVGTVLSR